MLPNKRFALLLGLTLGLLQNTTYATQACLTSIINEWPDSRYTNHNNGTVTDTVTDLMWMQCSLGQESANNTCTGTASTHTWKAALDLASDTSFVGYSDWRLPNIKELRSLVAHNCYSPSINQTLFPNTPSIRFWSSSPSAGDSGSAWNINFFYGYGYVSKRDGSYGRARLVRRGQ